MKSVYVVLLLAFVTTFARAHDFEGGKLKCSEAYEEGVKYRDINDATIYWICPEGQDLGVKEKCPENSGFLEDEQKCVRWESWYWKEPSMK